MEAIGDNPRREGLRDTPNRVDSMYLELFSGIGLGPSEAIDAVFEEDHRDPVILRNVTFYSVREHHLLPFSGLAHLAYIPSGKIAGISKLVRSLEVIARRPKVQERLTRQWGDAVFTALSPQGFVAQVEAEHLCMSMRGVHKPGIQVVTTAIRGVFTESSIDSESLLSLMKR